MDLACKRTLLSEAGRCQITDGLFRRIPVVAVVGLVVHDEFSIDEVEAVASSGIRFVDHLIDLERDECIFSAT